MANIRITQLPTNPSAITGTELVPIVQNGQTVHTTVAEITASPSQTQTFLTVGQQPTLPNSRYIGGGLGIGATDGGAQGLYSLFLNGTSASLENASTGIVVKSGVNTVVNRQLQTGTAGVSFANGNGISGDPTLSLTGLALSAATLSGSGLVSLVGGSYFQNVTLTGTASQISIANPNGGSNPTFSISDNPTLPGSAGALLPFGTTGQRASVPTDGTIRYNTTTTRFEGYRNGSWANFGGGDGTVTEVFNVVNQTSVINGTTTPTVGLANNPVLPGLSAVTLPIGATSDRTGSPVNGMLRYNTSTATFEGYANNVWGAIVTGSGVTSISTGTGLTGGPITSTGTISIANTAVTAGTYGSSYEVPQFTVNAQGQLTAAANVSISASAIGAVTSVSGTANEITSSGGQTPVLSLPSALTFTGKTVTGGAFNMTSATVGSDTVATLTATQTLTGKTISGASNTLTNIGNSSLTNSSITIGSTAVSLGSTITTFAGTSISGSTNTLSNIGNSSLTNSQITLGTTNIALGGTSLTPVGLTSVTVTQDPTSNFQLATKQYVDTVASTGIHYHTAVAVASPVSAGNLTSTYASGGTSTTITTIASGTYVTFASGVPTIGSQVTTATANGLVSGTQYWVTEIVGGTVQLSLTYGGAAITGLTNGTGLSIASVINAGVNATLTNAGTQVALTIDGVLTTVGMRVLIFNQTSAFQNGVYTVTTVGTASTNWVLTRATDANTYSPYSASALGQGDAFFVSQGTQGAGETWVVSVTGSIFFGQTNITFAQISDTAVYSAGTGLTLTGTQFSISNTAVTAGAYGSATQVGTFTVNAQGQLTLAGNTTVTPAVGSITGLGTGVATFLATPSSANLAAAVTDETGSGALVFATSPTLVTPALGTPSAAVLTNATGLPLTTGVTGVLPIANGGTNSTATATAGGAGYGTGTAHAYTAAGTAGQVLTSNGTSAPTWSGISGGTF